MNKISENEKKIFEIRTGCKWVNLETLDHDGKLFYIQYLQDRVMDLIDQRDGKGHYFKWKK